MRYLLVFVLVDISLFNETHQIAFKNMQEYVVTMNPIAITQFFYITYVVITDHLIISNKHDDFLEPIFYHYDIVKINGCNILHLHYMF